MRFAVKALLGLNRMFKAPVHPFNLQNAGEKTYAQWQYEKGQDTIAFFLRRYTVDEMFSGKTVLDIGCGAAGKSLFYANCGAEMVIGVEILEKYRPDAEGLAAQLGLSDRFRFVCADAAALPLEDNSVDTVIVNDAMEHVDEPEAVLRELLRVLKPGGRAFINFPPYHHPFGAHLSDAIYMPWVHLFFSERTLCEGYRAAVAHQPDAAARIEFRIAQRPDGREYFSYINHMTIKRFKRILNKMALTPVYYLEEPLRRPLAPFCKVPGIKEMTVKMVACVLEK